MVFYQKNLFLRLYKSKLNTLRIFFFIYERIIYCCILNKKDFLILSSKELGLFFTDFFRCCETLNYLSVLQDNFVFQRKKELSLYTSQFFQVKTLTAILQNINIGFNQGFLYEVFLRGIGFRCWQSEGFLFFLVGFSHLFKVKIPKNILVQCKKTQIFIFGSSKEKVKMFLSLILFLKNPDPYKNKGICEVGKVYRLKTIKKKQK